MRAVPLEAWILAGRIEGQSAHPALRADVCGMPHVLRLAVDLAHAGATTIAVVWEGDAPPPSLADLARDPRLRGARLLVVDAPPEGDDEDAIFVVRADRIYHRELAKLVAQAWRDGDAAIAKVDGAAFDGILACTRSRARELARAVRAAAPSLASTAIVAAPPPYLGFTVAAPDAAALRRAEKRLVWSLRKQAQGIAAYWINRHISLPVTRAIMRTRIRPNHVTLFCLALGIAGGLTIAQGGYLAGLAGMALVNLGSILDGVDGELARLKYQFSDIGAWLDTLADDVGNAAYVTGIAINLDGAGASWALPVGAVALACFAATQGTQYFLILKVYRSGDLAAIPWLFQSTAFLTARPRGVVERVRQLVPKLLKRDSALTIFVALAALGRLDVILLLFTASAVVFVVVFAVQLARNLDAIRATRVKTG